MAYSQKVVDRFESVLKNPEKHSVGRFDPNDPNVATGIVGAPACGDVMKLQLKLDENGIIIDYIILLIIQLIMHLMLIAVHMHNH